MPASPKDLKSLIQANNAELAERFRAGAPIAGLIRARADFIDGALIAAWRRYLGEFAGSLCLAAVGGYGRRELHPHSDIDILILLPDPAQAAGDCAWEQPLEQAITAFYHFVLDSGLYLGHSVRTLSECVAAARDDQTVMTNLMEARLLAGAKPLFDTLMLRTGPEHLWPTPLFFAAKMEEQRKRYHKYHDTAYNLEPNVKEGPGGLRDIQIIGWIVKRHHRSADLRDLIVQGWLTEAEFAELQAAQEYLWRVRFALHRLTGRAEDRLLFDYQRDLASQFGHHQDDAPNAAVEQFMQHYFRTVMGLERLNEMVLQLFAEIMLTGEQDSAAVPINAYFQSVNNYIEARDPEVFKNHPHALLEIFLILQQNAELQGIRAATIRLIRQHLSLVDDGFREDPEACRLFMDILRQPGGITHQLRRMNRYGLLAAYLPAFGNVVGRMQYDLFHVYTVDEHTLFVVRNLRRFAMDRHHEDHPHCNELFPLIEKPELLYIAALLHDIAKGTGGDHSEVGEKIALAFCQRHGLDHREAELVQWLVRHHLLMSMTAQRKDISDPQVIHEFATLVGDPDRLTHLYLLTVADIRATNPSLWNSWKGALLHELFTATRRAFRSGLEKPADLEQRVRVARADTLALLHRLGLTDEAVEQIWPMVANDYFMRFQPEEIAWHTVAIASCGPDDLPMVLLRPASQRGSAEIFIHARNQDFIFAHSTAVLDQLGLTILDARIITTGNDFVINSYHVLEQSGEPIKDQRRQIQICSRLRQCLLDTSAEPIQVQRLVARQTKHFAVPTQVYFHRDAQQRCTIIELIATDRPGLLSKVGQAFCRVGIRLYDARISTIGSRAEDIFHITDRQDRPLADDSVKRQLRDAIIELAGEN
ncbi:MAG: [protein-PII] uridylyltransferase [Candidatus Methylumidiphilus sp.]